jgi:hypothetical protein
MSGPSPRNEQTPTRLRANPRSILALDLVSLFMDISSELIRSPLRVFPVSVLGASMLSIGVIEGMA